MTRIVILSSVIIVYFIVEYHVFQSVQILTVKSSLRVIRLVWSSYWLWVALMIVSFFIYPT